MRSTFGYGLAVYAAAQRGGVTTWVLRMRATIRPYRPRTSLSVSFNNTGTLADARKNEDKDHGDEHPGLVEVGANTCLADDADGIAGGKTGQSARCC